MAFLDWTPKFSVGSPVLDQQHKVLLSLINQLHGTMLRGGRDEDVQKIFLELISYTESHFKAEEAMLSRIGYPKLAAHRVQHVAFVEKIRALNGELLAGEFKVSIHLLEFLKTWLSEHILGTDQQYVAFLNPVQSAASGRV
jgi:hemerythrin